jgi:hypothetical protein
VPASRSRTERWRDCLRQVYERDGALEISVAQGGVPAPEGACRGGDLVWRVRMAGMNDQHLLVEQPCAAGQWIELLPGVELVAGLAIGQNRWMFHTRVLHRERTQPARTVRLAAPESVERCQRRSFFRISTAELSLPGVECWPLLDPGSVVAAEVANRAVISELIRSGGGGGESRPPSDDTLTLPEVGPRFTARLMNVGGGGAGLLIERGDWGALDRARLFWLRVNLMPDIPAPIGLTARLVHTHLDSAQNLYAGLAFEWAFNPSHREFVIDQITRYAGELQKRALLKSA